MSTFQLFNANVHLSFLIVERHRSIGGRAQSANGRPNALMLSTTTPYVGGFTGSGIALGILM